MQALEFDRSNHRLVMAFFTAMTLAALAGLVAIPLLEHRLSGGWAADGLLLAGLGGIAALSLLARILVRTRRLRPGSRGTGLILFTLSLLLLACIVRTGGILSPLFVLLFALAGLLALTAKPASNVLGLCALALAYCAVGLLSAKGAIEGGRILDASGGALSLRDHFPVIAVQLCVLVLFGVSLNLLAVRARDLQDELGGLSVCDPCTGALQPIFFHARLAALAQRARLRGQGVGLLLVDLGPEAPDEILAGAGTVLRDGIRGRDLAGWQGDGRFALALDGTNEAGVEKVARRIAGRLDLLLQRLGAPSSPALSRSYLPASALPSDPGEAARRLLENATSRLEPGAVPEPVA